MTSQSQQNLMVLHSVVMVIHNVAMITPGATKYGCLTLDQLVYS